MADGVPMDTEALRAAAAVRQDAAASQGGLYGLITTGVDRIVDGAKAVWRNLRDNPNTQPGIYAINSGKDPATPYPPAALRRNDPAARR